MFVLTLTAALLAASAQTAAAPSSTTAPARPPQGTPAQSAAAVDAPRRVLSLDQAISAALERNPDQLRAQLQAQQAISDVTGSRSSILPQVDVTASAGRNRTGESTSDQFVNPTTGLPFTQSVTFSNNFQARIAVRQLIFDGGKWWNNLAAANLGSEAAAATTEEQKLTTVYTVQQRFYELVRAQRQLRVLTDAAARSRDQAENVQRLFDGGRQTQQDVYSARANRDQDEVTRLSQERAVEFARQDLALAIGIDPSEPLAIAEPQEMMVDPAAPPPASETVQRALTRRPSLTAFARNVERNRKQVSAARGDYLPTVSAGLSYGKQYQHLGDVTAALSPNSTLSGSINLNWNVFNGFGTSSQVDRAALQAQLAEVDLANGRRAVASDVERAIAGLAAARAQASVAAQAEQTAGESLRLARTRQQVGVGTQIEVRDAELKLTQSQLSRVNALVDGRVAEAGLRRAVGG